MLEFNFVREIDAKLVEAILLGDAVKVREAINDGADVNAVEDSIEERSPIHFAIIQTNPEIISILRDNKADLNKLRSSFNKNNTFLATDDTHPLLMCLPTYTPNNKVIAKALLNDSPNIGEQAWYHHERGYHKKIENLRAENSTAEAKSTQASPEESSDGMSRLFYRLKATFFHNKYLLASTGFVVSIPVLTSISLAYTFALTASTLSLAIGVQYLSDFGFEDEDYYLGSNDIRKGIEFVWSNGVKSAIDQIYNAPKYKNPNNYREYSYTPGEIIPVDSAKSL